MPVLFGAGGAFLVLPDRLLGLLRSVRLAGLLTSDLLLLRLFGLLMSVLLADLTAVSSRDVLPCRVGEVKPRGVDPNVPGPFDTLPLLLLLLKRLALLPLSDPDLLTLFLTGLSNSVLPEEQREVWEPDLFLRPSAWQE